MRSIRLYTLTDKKRKELMDLCANEIDAPEPMVEIGGTMFPMRYLEMMQEAIRIRQDNTSSYAGIFGDGIC